MILIRAIINRASGQQAITEIIGRKFYPLTAGDKAKLPYVTFQIISGGSLNASNGPTGTFNRQLQINCIAATYVDVKRLADAVRDGFNGWRDSGGTPNIGSCSLENEIDDFDEPHSGKQTGVFRVIQHYSIWYA